MFDAAGAATADPTVAAAADPAAADHAADTRSDHPAGQVAETPQAVALPSPPPAVPPPVEVRAADPAQNDGKREVVFIESNVADYQTLIDGTKAGVEIVLLDPTKDGLSQMAQWAQTHGGYDAIHVISHGAEGRVNLGALTLDMATAISRAADLATLGSTLTAEGDLLLYGCDVATGAGQDFITTVATVTGADVAASSDPTGAARLGGDWVLEASAGTIDRPSLQLSSYSNVLTLVGASVYSDQSLMYSDSNNTVAITNSATPEIDFGPFDQVNIETSGNTSTITMTVGAAASSPSSSGNFYFTGGTLDHLINATITSGTATNKNALSVSVSDKTLTVNFDPANATTKNGNGEIIWNVGDTVVITVTSTDAPASTITSAAYDASTNQLVVTGTNLTNGGAIDETKLTLKGQGGQTYTLTESGNITASSTTQFSITLNATDQINVEGLLNKNGTSSAGGTTYNIAAAADWHGTGNADLTSNAVTVSNTQTPTISSATYNQSTGVLTVTGTNLVKQSGATNDIDLTKLTITGQGNGTQALTGAVEIIDATTFSVTLSGATKTAVDALLNANGTQSSGGTTFNLAAADDWNGPITGGDIKDLTGNAITVSGLNNAPTIGGITTTTTINDTATATPFSSVTITDADNDNVTVSVTLDSSAKGVFTSASLTASGFTSAGGGVYNLTSGSAAAAQAAIRQLVFDPTDNRVAAGSTETTTFTIAVNDGTTTTSSNTTTVTSTSVNDAPTLSTPTAGSYTDTAAADTFSNTSGTLSGSDVDFSATLTYGISSGTTGGSTVISSVTYDISKAGTYGTLYVVSTGSDKGKYVYVPSASAINALASGTPTDSFTVTVSDGSLSGNATFTVNISGANDTPVSTVAPAVTGTHSVGQTLTADTGTFTDAEGTTPTYSYQWYTATDNTGAAAAAISGATSSTYALTTSEAHKYVRVVVTASDGSLTATGNSAWTLVANSAPSLTSPGTVATYTDTAAADTFATPATGSATGTLSATDADGDTKTYGISSGTTGGSTVISSVTYDISKAGSYGTLYVKSTTGEYIYVPTANAMNAVTNGSTPTDSFTVTVSDGNSGSDSKTLTIGITGANDAPSNITLTGSSVSTFDGANATVGTLTATDVDDTGWTYSITTVKDPSNQTVTNTNGAVFDLGTTGSSFTSAGSATATLRAVSPSSLSAGTYTITVQAQDAGGQTYSKDVMVTVSSTLVVTVTAIDSSAPSTYTADAADGGGLDLQEALNYAQNATGSVTIQFSSGLSGTITLGGTYTVRDGVTLAMDSSGNSRSLSIASNSLLLGGAFGISVAAGDTLTIGSTLADDGTVVSALSKSGTGTLVLGGTNNTATGGTTGTGLNTISLTAGTLQIGADGNLGTGTVTVNSGTLSLNSLGGGTVDNDISLGSSNGTVNVANSAAILSGSISGSGALSKTGGQLLTLSGTNSYSGGTTVSGANGISVTGSGNLGSGTVTLNTTLKITGSNTTVTNAIAINSDSAIISNASAVTLSGVVSGSHAVEKQGGGTLTLGGANTHTGNWAVSAGTLTASSGAAIGDSSSVTLSGSGTFRVSASETVGALTGNSTALTDVTIDNGMVLTATYGSDATMAGAIGGLGSFTKAGSGTLTLSGSNSYTGATTVNGGGLTIDGGLDVNSAVTVGSGTTLTVGASALEIGSLAGAGTVAVASGKELTVGSSNASTEFSGGFSGAGSLTKMGSGTMTLSGTSSGSFSGTTEVREGTLSIAGDANLGTGAVTLNGGTLTVTGAGTIDNAMTLGTSDGTVNTAVAVTLSGVIGGSGNLTKAGSGTLTLSGSNSYSGSTTVSAGTVSIAADGNLGSGAVTLAAGSKLQVTGATTIDNAVALTGSAEVQTDAAVTISGNITGNTRTLTKSGSGTLTLSGTNNSSGSGVSGITVSAGTLAVGASTNLGQTTLTLDGGTLASTAVFSSGTGVTLGSSGGTVDVSAGSITLSGTVSGTGGLSITSTNAGNVLGLSGTNSYSGGTTLGSGILEFGSDAAAGTGTLTVNGGKLRGSGSTARTIANNLVLGGTMTMSGSAALTFTGTVDLGSATRTINNTITESLTLNGAVSNGSLTVANSGTGALVLGGTNSMTGITVSSGTLSIADAASLGSGTTTLSGGTLSITGATTIANDIALSSGSTISNSAAATLSGVLSGSGTLTKSGAGTLTLSGTNTHTGDVTVSAGTLAAAGGSAIGDTSAVTVSSGATLSLGSGNETIGSLAGAGNVVLSYRLTAGGNNSDTTFSGIISSTNTSGLTKTGTGTLTLSGANTYTGSTTVSAGGLTLSGGSAIADSNTVTVASGATLTLGATEVIGSLAGAGTVSIGANTLYAGGNNTSTSFSGTFSGSGNFYKLGTGTLTLSGTNSSSFTGSMTVRDGGTLSVAGDANLGAGTVTLNGGTLTVTGADTIDNVFDTGVNGATIDTGVAVTLSGAIGGSDGLTKTGTGTLTLSGTSTYAGATTVSAGTLLVTGALGGTSGVTVSSGATLGGTGSIFASGSANTLTINSGATLAPGVAGTNNGIGTLTVNGALAMNGTLAVQLAGNTTAGTDYDQVIVSGGVTLASGSSAVTVSRVNGYAAANATYRVIDSQGIGAITSTLSGLAQGDTMTSNGDLYTVDYVGGTGNDLVLNGIVNPTVSSVTASTADGTYKAGSTVTITVTFNRAVTVTGTPLLALGITGRSATYSGGSGTTTLTFSYTVQDGDNSADLDYASTGALTLNGGGIADSSTSLDAILTLATPGAANSLGANKAIVIDTAAPTVSSVSAVNGTYRAGDTMDVTVTFNEAVTVTGSPTLAITLDNGTVVQATYLAGSGGTTLTFRYTVGNNLVDTDGISIGATVSGGSITDLIGNSAIRTLNNIASTGAVRIDSVAPTVTSVTASTDNGTYTTGDTVTIQVVFSEAVAINGTPTLALNTGRTATYSSGSGTNTLTFTYTVQAGDTSADLDAVSTSALTGSITDIAGNTGALTLTTPGDVRSLGLNKDIAIDTTAPSIRSVVVPTDGSYGVGKTLSFYIQVSEVVIVNGVPTITLDIGGQTRQAVYNAAASSGTVLRFDYVVQAGDSDNDGIAVTGLTLNGGSITDKARIPLSATLTGLPGLQNVLVDTVAPDTPSVPVLATGQDTGISATDGLTNINRPTLGGTAEAGSTVTVLVDGVAVGTTIAGSDGRWSFTPTTPLTDGTHAVTSRATDPAGNSSGTSAALTLTIDTTAPVLSTPALSGVDNAANVISSPRPTLTGTADPNSTVTIIVDGVPVGTATTGSDGRWSFAVATPLADGAHSVVTTDTDSAGNIGRSGPLSLTVDTQAPTLSAGSAPTLSAGGTATLGSAVSLSDASSLNRVTVTLADARSGDELVIGSLPAGITAARDGTSIVLTGVASAADYQAAVRAIGLRSSASDPSFAGTATSRSISIQARDLVGNSSTATTVTVAVARVTTTTTTNTTNTPATTTPVTGSGNGPSLSSNSVTGSSSNGPSSNSSSNSVLGGTGGSGPSLPGSGSTSSGGPLGSSSSTDAGRSVTLNSVSGSSSSTDAGRSVTLNSIGGGSSSTDAGRSVTLNSIGGNSTSSSSFGSGLGGSGLGSTLGGSIGSSLGGSGLGSLGGNGLGTGGTPGGTGTGTGINTGSNTGTGPATGGTTRTGTNGQGTPGQNNGQGQLQGQGQERGNGLGTGQPGNQGQDQGQQGQGQQGQGEPQGQPQNQGAPQEGGGTPADGSSQPAERQADNRAEIMPASPGFARQVARVHGGPAGAADLLAALASHVLPDSWAA
jgi:autotransporter-associated beta strand protein